MPYLIDVDKAIHECESEIRKYEEAIKALKDKILIIKELAATAAPINKSKRVTVEQMSLSGGIMFILNKSQKWLKAREIADMLLDEGFKSISNDFTVLVANMLNKMRKKQKIQYKHVDGGVLYAHLNLAHEKDVFSLKGG
jgi:hypothetical protein